MISERELPVIQPVQSSVASRIPTSLWFALCYPFVLTVYYFVFMNGQETSSQNTVFSVLKAIQFSFPAIFVFLVCRESIELPVWKKPAIKVGLIFGGMVFLPSVLLTLRVMQYLSPALVGILMLSEVLVAVISAMIFLGETLSIEQGIGIVVILVAGFVVATSKETRPQESSTIS